MKSRRFISIFLCVTLLLTLPAPAALANGWGLKRGLMLNAVSKTHDYDEYSALAQLKVQDGEVAVMASRYHAVLLFAYEFNGKTRLDAYHTAVLQPDEKGYKKVKLQRRDPGFVLQYSDMELYFTPLLSNEALTYMLEAGALGSLTVQAGGENSELTSYLTVSDGKNSVKWYGWQHATPSLAEFNLRLFPRTMDEIGAMRELIHVVAPQFVDYELYSADEMPGDAGAATVPVYSAPGDGSVRFAKGKASVNLRAPVKFYGLSRDESWMLVEYEVSDRTSRFGYVRRSELPSSVTWKYNISSIDMPVTVTQDTFLTDDPNVSQYQQMTLKAGGSWIKLDPSGVRMGGSRINLGGGGGPGSGSGAAPELPITPDLVDYFTEYFILKANGTPFPDAQYTIILDDQSTFGGVTDKDGKTSMVIDRSKKVGSVVFDQGFPIEIA